MEGPILGFSGRLHRRVFHPIGDSLMGQRRFWGFPRYLDPQACSRKTRNVTQAHEKEPNEHVTRYLRSTLFVSFAPEDFASFVNLMNLLKDPGPIARVGLLVSSASSSHQLSRPSAGWSDLFAELLLAGLRAAPGKGFEDVNTDRAAHVHPRHEAAW